MAETETSVTFSVSVLIEKDKNSTKIIQNAIRKTSVRSSWYDLFEAVTENVTESPEFPGTIWENFEKNAKIVVSTTPNGEPYHPDPYDVIKTLTDFNQDLKFVNIIVKHPSLHDLPNDTDTCTPTRNVNDVLMEAQLKKKEPKKIPCVEGERFTGNIKYTMHFQRK